MVAYIPRAVKVDKFVPILSWNAQCGTCQWAKESELASCRREFTRYDEPIPLWRSAFWDVNMRWSRAAEFWAFYRDGLGQTIMYPVCSDHKRFVIWKGPTDL